MLDSNFYLSMSNVMTQWNDFKVSKHLYKAYFDMKKAESSSDSNAQEKTKKITHKNNVEDKLGTLSSNVSSAVSKLDSAFAVDKETGEMDYDKAFTAAEGFVNSYNELVSSIRTSGNESISGKHQFISNMTNAYTKRLSDVGITVQSDGKLAIDKDTFKSASASELEKIFGKKESFASFMESQAKQLSNLAAKETAAKDAATYNQSGTKATENALTSGAILNMLS